MSERIAETLPANPFKHYVGNPEFVEYTSKLTTTHYADGKRVYREIEQPMRHHKGIAPYDQIRQLMERCRLLEEENARLTAELDAATAPEGAVGGKKKTARKG